MNKPSFPFLFGGDSEKEDQANSFSAAASKGAGFSQHVSFMVQ